MQMNQVCRTTVSSSENNALMGLVIDKYQLQEDFSLLLQKYPPLPHYFVDVDGGPEVVIEAYENNEPIPVYTGDSDDTIWGEPEFNWLFRAQHDSLHLRHNIPFTLMGEYHVAEVHAALAEGMGLYDLARVIRIDVAAFATYQEDNEGKFAPQTLTQTTITLVDVAVELENEWASMED